MALRLRELDLPWSDEEVRPGNSLPSTAKWLFGNLYISPSIWSSVGEKQSEEDLQPKRAETEGTSLASVNASVAEEESEEGQVGAIKGAGVPQFQ